MPSREQQQPQVAPLTMIPLMRAKWKSVGGCFPSALTDEIMEVPRMGALLLTAALAVVPVALALPVRGGVVGERGV